LLEQRAARQEIDVYFGDETQISEEGYVPYGWQFKDENVSIKSQKGAHINCFVDKREQICLCHYKR
jgi:hypothetical protein